MPYELQARDRYGNWDASNVTWNPDATQFATRDEAEAERQYWIGEGRNPEDLQIIEIK